MSKSDFSDVSIRCEYSKGKSKRFKNQGKSEGKKSLVNGVCETTHAERPWRKNILLEQNLVTNFIFRSKYNSFLLFTVFVPQNCYHFVIWFLLNKTFRQPFLFVNSILRF